MEVITRLSITASSMYARAPSIISIAFMVLIALPLVGLIGGDGSLVTIKENRALAVLPQASTLSSLTTFTAELDGYLADHFGFRAPLIFAQNMIRVVLLGATPTRPVTIGKGGWMFLGAPRDIAHQRLFTDDQLVAYTALLKERREAFRNQGIDYRVMVIPTSDGVYTNYWPDGLASSSFNTYDQFVRYVEPQLPGLFIHTKEILRAHRIHSLPEIGLASSTIYYRYDSHWNSVGVFLGMNVLLNDLHATYPCVIQISATTFSVREDEAPETTADQLALGPWVHEKTQFLSVKESTVDSCNERILFVGDSMVGQSLVEWMRALGYTIAFIDRGVPQFERDEAIAAFKPSILIDERQESRLTTLFTRPE